MAFSWTLFRYLSTRFLMGIITIGACLTALIFLVDLVESLRRFADKSDVAFTTIVAMGLFKTPYLMGQILPFIFLFGAIYSFTQLTRNHELIIVRAAGVSVWQFLMPALLVAFLSGVFIVTLYNPISSSLYSRFEQLKSSYSSGTENLLEVSADGLWLRQGTPESQSVIHALSIENRAATLRDVIIFNFVGTDEWTGRIDAEVAQLENGFWVLSKAQVTEGTNPTVFHETYELPTSLTETQIQDSFADPDTISFWELPEFIRVAEAAGFTAIRHRLHFQSILSTPILLCAMVLIAASFSLRLTRLGGIGRLVIIGVLFGFFLYFASDLSRALGISGNLPVLLAAWIPTLIALLLGVATLLHMEDG